ncbi:YggT family protein [Paenibacillus doosanensis]|uniref:YGGT family protein n=2 Tax=Paenibacillus konkukensis TaxID=2020716 RepID=A0ABY4S0A5_9BACL|nr:MULTISPECIES: YggT family protein [Paenibacillus]MCS7459279.1 YggT family protein [Paenibacillus doosanensis]UQZ87073.1 YGGT family protein [Paenibacillus konkukensis]
MYNSIDGYIYTLIEIYTYMLIAYVLLSWLPSARDSFVGEILGKLCEPYLSIFRRFIPPIGGMIDISPIVALIALRFVGEGIRAVVNFFI